MNALTRIASTFWHSRLFQTLVFIYCLLNLKSFPLFWHFRFYRALYAHFYFRKRIYPKPSHLFSPVFTASRAPLYECDVNIHKSNSTYFSDLDIARTHLVAHLTKRSFAERKAKGLPLMYVALAGVNCVFKKEIKPMQGYEIASRILAWDQKWLYAVSHFVGWEGKGQGRKRRVFASALSKYVFKNGRVTIQPEVVLRESGLLPERPDGEQALTNGNGVETPMTGLEETMPGEEKMVPKQESEDVLRDLDEKLKSETVWTWEKIEEERKRGLMICENMARLDALVDEFREGDEEGLEKVGPFFVAT